MRVVYLLIFLTLTACGSETATTEPKALLSYWSAAASGAGWFDLDLRTSNRATFYYDDGGVCACDAVVSESSFAASNCTSTAPANCALGPGVATLSFTPGSLHLVMDNNAQLDFE